MSPARVRVVTLVCAVIVAVGLIGSGWFLAHQQSDTQNTAEQAQRLTEQIQRERIRNTSLSCEQTNGEHLAIVTFITASVPKDRRDDPVIAKYLDRARRAFPVQDCAALVKRRVQNP